MSNENENTKIVKEKKAKKPLSKGAKIGIVAGVTVVVIILITVITLVAILLKPSAPSGPVDDSALAMQTNEINVGKIGSIDAGKPVVILSDVLAGKTDFSCDSAKATIEDRTIGDVSKKVMVVLATDGSFDLTYKNEAKVETIKVNVVNGVNVYTIAEFEKAIKDEGTKIINIQADLTAVAQKGYELKDVVINGNGYTFDATSISARTYTDKGKVEYGGSTVFSILVAPNTEVIVRDFHLIGEQVKKVEGQEFSLDEFESNGILFSVYGDGTTRAKFTLEHSILENASKHLFIRSADVLVKDSLLRNGADAIIAVETNQDSGAVLTVENNIISNSVVAGILFCGWTNVGNDAKTTCKLVVKGFLDIYNWKDTNTAKLVPSSEGWMADAVNNMVGSQIRGLISDPKAVKTYMAKVDGEFFVHIGIIILATGDFKENKTIVEGIDIESGSDKVGYVKRGFPIPKFASAIAKTCELIGYNQKTADKSTSVKPKTGYGNSKNFTDLGFSVVGHVAE